MNLRAFCDLTKPRFTLFSLPFLTAQAELALLTARFDESFSSERLLYSAICALGAFFCARCSGMMFNAVIDAEIDARNPRTQQRAIPRQLVLKQHAARWAVGLLCVSLVLAFALGKKCLVLCCISFVVIVLYPYAKYVSSLCHFVLGSIYTLAMLAAAACIKDSLSLADFLFGLTAMQVIAANDIGYAMQDIDFDRRENIFSIPAKMGIRFAKTLMYGLFFGSYLSFASMGYVLRLPAAFYMLSMIPLSVISYMVIWVKNSLQQNPHKTFILGNIAIPVSFFTTVTLFLLVRLWEDIS